MEKTIVAPQIVIYKNIFKNSNELINLLEENDPNSIFGEWKPWYEQGLRKMAFLDENISLDTEKRKIELNILKQISDIVDGIQIDYFSMYSGEKGIWPEYIKNWNILNEPLLNKYIDYFKYTLSESDNRDDLEMPYHVDEFVIPGTYKKARSVVTINFYLNNNYSGGEICMYDSISKKSFKYKPNPGDVVIMPSTYPFYHAVKSYSKADRYFLRTFISYPVNETSDGNYDWHRLEKEEDNFIDNNLQAINVFSNEIIVE